MNTNIAYELKLAQDKSQYDEHAKRILGNVWITASILKAVTKEFRHVPLRQIVQEYISGNIMISNISVMPGSTNLQPSTQHTDLIVFPERIAGSTTEDKVPNEGCIYYDIRFTAYAPGKKLPIKLLFNIEAQKSFYTGYSLVTRGIFYTARMLSAQLDTEFTVADYSGLKKVYSIWICMNSPNYIGNATAEYHLQKTDITPGIPDKPEEYDKLSVIMICLNRNVPEAYNNGITGLLNTLFSETFTIKDKERILSGNYGITMTHDIGKELVSMCNLSEGIWERGIEQGIERGRLLLSTSIIRSSLNKGVDISTIADTLGESVDFVQKITSIITAIPSHTDNEIVDIYLHEA